MCCRRRPDRLDSEHAVARMLAAAERLVPNQLRLRAGTGEYVAVNDGVELAGRALDWSATGESPGESTASPRRWR